MRTLAANCAVMAASAALALLAFPLPVSPATGPYTIEGGTPQQRAEVGRALAASSFDWSIVPVVVRVRIGRGSATWARSGHVRLGAEVLDRGRASWGVVQHEFAHQIDFFLFDDADRERMRAALGGKAWWPNHALRLAHGAYGCERFASTLAWTFWPSRHNVLRPRTRSDESAAMKPARFRALLARVLAD
jgi:hypothetical protein